MMNHLDYQDGKMRIIFLLQIEEDYIQLLKIPFLILMRK